jgi:hypothetical protein
MPQVTFDPKTPVFKRAKTGHALDREATVIGESDHSPPSNVEVNSYGAKPPLPHMSSWHSAQLITTRDSFIFA